MVTVTGQAGAVPLGQPDRPWDSVIVVAVEWGTQDCVDRRSDGSFDAQLEAPVGSTLYVMPIERGHCVGQGIQTGPAAVLAVPGTSSIAPDSGSFATLGRAGSELKWSAQGSLTGPGRSVEFVVHDGPGEECLMPRIHLYRLFDAEGGYVTQVNVNVHGPPLTPTACQSNPTTATRATTTLSGSPTPLDVFSRDRPLRQMTSRHHSNQAGTCRGSSSDS